VWGDDQTSSSRVMLPAVNMTGTGQPARGQQYNEKQRCGGKADNNGRKHQRLGKGVGYVRGAINNGWCAQGDTTHAENEQVDGVRNQRQAHNDLKGAWSQHQPYA